MTSAMKAANTRRENKARAARMAASQAATAAIVTTGVCPCCKAPLKRNLSLTGWWQCAAFGEPIMRAAEHRNLPKCSWQGFTAQ